MSFLNLSKEEIKNFLINNNFKTFHVKQIIEWIYGKFVLSFDGMSNLSIELREKLKNNFKLYSLSLKKSVLSKDGQTKKYLFELEDGCFIESVLILDKKRITLCVSSQIGCPIKCKFCASGRGFRRNLKFYEILEQIIHISRDFNNTKPTHIVFMGMGEPLLNLQEVLKAIDIINDLFKISQRRITISTVGILEGLKKLKEKNLKINLAISLHAADDLLRNQLIPYSKKYKLKELIDELKSYFKKTKRDLLIEYILIDGVNDKIEDAKKLVFLLKNTQCCVNLIPYNPIKRLEFKRSNNKQVKKFKSFLISKKLNVTQRYTKGDDITSACGQLAFNDNVPLNFN